MASLFEQAAAPGLLNVNAAASSMACPTPRPLCIPDRLDYVLSYTPAVTFLAAQSAGLQRSRLEHVMLWREVSYDQQ